MFRLKRFLALFAFFLLILSAHKVDAKAEGRMYLHANLRLSQPHQTKHDPFLLQLMLRSEQRFQEEGLVLLKDSFGLRVRVLPWLRFRSYYAHKDVFSSAHKQSQLLAGDVIFLLPIGSFLLLDRNGNEWHITDHFYRYRNYFQVLFHINRWLSVWSSDEFRIDSDQARVNMNDLRVGFLLKPVHHLKIRIFYDLESKHRSKVDWTNHFFLGLVLMVSI